MGLTFAVTAARVTLSHLVRHTADRGAARDRSRCLHSAEPTRKWLVDVARRERMWRPIAKAMGFLGMPEAEISRRSAGGRRDICCFFVSQPGGIADDFAKASELLAVCFRARTVRVQRDPADASRVSVTVVTRDPFKGPGMRWPWTEIAHTNLWAGLPLGNDEEQQPVSAGPRRAPPADRRRARRREVERLVARGCYGGAGSECRAVVLRCEAGRARSVARHLEGLRRSRHRRGDRRSGDSSAGDGPPLQVAARREDEESDRPIAVLGLVVVVIDELALYLQGTTKTRNAFAIGLRDLVARGRAAGIVVVAATQKPAHDVVPTSLRDLFGYRLALRCSTREASDTVLGSGWASAGLQRS